MTQRLTLGQVLTGIRDFGLRVTSIENLPVGVSAGADCGHRLCMDIVRHRNAGTLAHLAGGDVVSTTVGHSNFGDVTTFTVREPYGYHGTLEIRPNHGRQSGYRVQADQRFRDMIEA